MGNMRPASGVSGAANHNLIMTLTSTLYQTQDSFYKHSVAGVYLPHSVTIFPQNVNNESVNIGSRLDRWEGQVDRQDSEQ